MTSKIMLALCLAGLLAFPASLVLACHLELANVELGCTQYKIAVKAVGASPTQIIHYTFTVPSNTGGPPLTINNRIPVAANSGNFVDSITNSISLVGNYDAQSLLGSASVISSTGHVENTIKMTFSSTALECAPQS